MLIRFLPQLVKIKVTAAVTLTTALGYLLNQPPASSFLPAIAGTFLLACGSASLNQMQDAGCDRLMKRTSGRPVAAGKISPASAGLISAFLILSGYALLRIFCGFTASSLGAFTLLCYNGVYTPLKRVTAFAVLPGALVGALPPIIGWTAAGGDVFSGPILALSFFIFLWQVPHFWALLLIHAAEYQAAGLPCLSDVFSAAQVKRLTFSWIVCAAFSGMLLPLYGTTKERLFPLIYSMAALPLVLYSGLVLWRGAKYNRVFNSLNAFVFLILAFLFCESSL